MELAEFYRAVLPPTGHYALFHSKRKQHVWFDSIDSLVEATQKRADQPFWYYATASFMGRERKQEVVAAKRCFYVDIDAGAEKFAKHPQGAWPSIQDAVRALSAFIAETKLTPSLVISSGGGLHVYWTLSESIGAAEWTATAESLKRLARVRGLRADPACTSDSARVLRAIGTTHHDDVRVQVLRNTGVVYDTASFAARILAAGASDVDTDVLAGLDQGSLAAPAVQFAGFDDVGADFRQYESVPVSAVKIKSKCAAIAEIADDPANVAEPIWRGMIGLVKHTVEGAAVAHEWSKGHPDYDALQTQEKFDRYAAGPTTCETFSAYSSKCGACPHNGKIKSPIVLGRITVEDERKPELAGVVTAAAANPLPTAPFGDDRAAPVPVAGIPTNALGDGYKCELVGGRPVLFGRVVQFIKQDDGETTKVVVWLPFTEDVFWLTGWTEAGRHDHENSMLALVLLRGNRSQAFDLPNETTADRKALLKYLNSKSINPLNYKGETTAMMQQYVNDQIRRVKNSASKPVIRDHLGFHMDSKGDLFCAHGKYLIMKDGTIREALLGRTLDTVRSAFVIDGLVPTPTGEWPKTVWQDITKRAKKQVEFYRKWWTGESMEVAQFAIMMQLAGPLLVFAAPTDMAPEAPLPAIGLTVSLFSSGSAKGKTSIQTAATYAYGDPGSLMRQGDRLGMTFNAQIAMAASLGTMPFPMDEVTTNDPSQVGESINRIASGTEKVRANKEGGISRPPVSWALVSTVSTNVPQRELVASYQQGSDALQMRLIELNCDVLPTRGAGIVPEYDDALREAMSESRGCLGALIHLYCVSRGYKFMREQMLANISKAATLSPGESKERFILRGIAAVMTLLDILDFYKATLFDRDIIMQQAVVALESARTYAHADNLGGTTSSFTKLLREVSPSILLTDEDPFVSEVTAVQNEQRVRMPYLGRACRNTGVLYLSIDAIKEWCTQNRVSATNVLTQAAASGYLAQFDDGKAQGFVNLTRGVRAGFLPRTKCIKVLLSAINPAQGTGDNVVEMRRATQDQRPMPPVEAAT